MRPLQEDFLRVLKSKSGYTSHEYALLYNKHTDLSSEEELRNTGDKYRAKTMGNYYTISVLSDFLKNDVLLEEIMEISEKLLR
jgi:hypothetical protein